MPIRDARDLATYLAADLEMHGLSRWRWHYRLTKRTVYFQRQLRRSEYWHNSGRSGLARSAVRAVMRMRVKRLGERLGFECPRNVFGPGLSIAHPGLLVVNDMTVVGSRCRIHQGVTLGGTGEGAPRIGDDVFIGPNALVIGPVSVGDRAYIYPGAVVTKDVADGEAVAGVPARVIGPAPSPWRPDPVPPARP